MPLCMRSAWHPMPPSPDLWQHHSQVYAETYAFPPVFFLTGEMCMDVLINRPNPRDCECRH